MKHGPPPDKRSAALATIAPILLALAQCQHQLPVAPTPQGTSSAPVITHAPPSAASSAAPPVANAPLATHSAQTPATHARWVRELARARGDSLTHVRASAFAHPAGFFAAGTFTRDPSPEPKPTGPHAFARAYDLEGAQTLAFGQPSLDSSLSLSHAQLGRHGVVLSGTHGGKLTVGRFTAPAVSYWAEIVWILLDQSGEPRELAHFPQALSEWLVRAAVDESGATWVLYARYADSPTLRAGALFKRHDVMLRKLDARGRTVHERKLGHGGPHVAAAVPLGKGVCIAWGVDVRFGEPEKRRVECRDERGEVLFGRDVEAFDLGVDASGTVVAFTHRPEAHVLEVRRLSQGAPDRPVVAVDVPSRPHVAVSRAGSIFVVIGAAAGEDGGIDARCIDAGGDQLWREQIPVSRLSATPRKQYDGRVLMMDERPVAPLGDDGAVVLTSLQEGDERGATARLFGIALDGR